MPDRTLDDMFDGFRREAFRLETRDDYSRSGNADAYRRFLGGEPMPDGYNADWLDEVGAWTRSGRRVYRVHVLSRPLTPYLRFELGWGYVTNATAGEEFFILDVTDQGNPLENTEDFWLFDSTTAVSMRYTDDGGFAGSEVLPDAAGPEYTAYRDAALAHAVPFTDWWAEHAG